MRHKLYEQSLFQLYGTYLALSFPEAVPKRKRKSQMSRKGARWIRWWRICLHCRKPGVLPGLGRSPGGGHGNPLPCSCLENPLDRGAWWATVHGVSKSRTLGDYTFTLTDRRASPMAPWRQELHPQQHAPLRVAVSITGLVSRRSFSTIASNRAPWPRRPVLLSSLSKLWLSSWSLLSRFCRDTWFSQSDVSIKTV